VPQGDRNIKGLEDVSVIGVTQIDRVVEVVEESLKGHNFWQKKSCPYWTCLRFVKISMLKLFPYPLVVSVRAHIARLDTQEGSLVHMILKLLLNAVNKLLKKEYLKYGLHQKTLVLMVEILEQASLSY
jgi:hypothetical protein